MRMWGNDVVMGGDGSDEVTQNEGTDEVSEGTGCDGVMKQMRGMCGFGRFGIPFKIPSFPSP